MKLLFAIICLTLIPSVVNAKGFSLCDEINEVVAEAVEEGYYSQFDAEQIAHRCESVTWEGDK